MKIIFAFFFSFFSLAYAQGHPSNGPTVPVQKISMDQFVHKFVRSLEPQFVHVQGGAIAIVYKGQVIYQKTFGYQKNKTGTITDTTLFPLASVSKTVSASVLAQLVKRGKVRWQDPVHYYIPQIPRGVKVQDILSHTSGYLKKDSDKLIEQGKERKDVFAHHLAQGPENASGKSYNYHNLMFSCTQDIVAKASGHSWASQVKQFWNALGVTQFATCTVDAYLHVASPHGKIEDKKGGSRFKWLRRVPNNYPEAVCSSAGLYTSLKGLIQFLKLHLGHFPQILSKADLALLHKPYVETKEIFSLWSLPWPFRVEKMEAFYGLGWRILCLKDDDTDQNQLIFHGGYLKGVNTFVGFMPRYDIGIVILTNQDAGWAVRTGIQFWGDLVKNNPFL